MVDPYLILGVSESLVLRVSIKMQKNELRVNFYTRVLNTKLLGELLWTNPSPSFAFTAQSLNDVNVSGYIRFIISFATSTETLGRVLFVQTTLSNVDLSTGNLMWIQFPSGQPPFIFQRTAYFTNGTISFGHCLRRIATSQETITSNNFIVPLSIQGYKY